MRKILLLLFYVTIGISVSAHEITRQQALQKARQFMEDKHFEPTVKKGNRSQLAEQSLGYYVFNAEDGGFVIVAGDDRMPDILGYSEQGYLDLENLPNNMKGLLDYYHAIATRLNNRSATRATNTRRGARAAISPLITTQWDQGAPYNEMCPLVGPNQNLLTGCVATAMAQIINYNKWPQSETSTVAAYTTEGLQIFMPELMPRAFPWDKMDDRYIARLMLYCGQSVKMDYGGDNGQSGANDALVPKALRNVFGYSTLTKYVLRSNYNDDEWESLIYTELSENRPVFYGGFGSSGGHAFVIDGYKDGSFHVNWGWGGNGDGYFLFTNLGPDNNSAYSQEQHAVIGIRPPKNEDPSEPPTEETGTHVKEHGITTIDGVSYRLVSIYSAYHATILPNMATGKYVGDIYVPDVVVYNGYQFGVNYFSWENPPFDDCDELTSLSIGLHEDFIIRNCPRLMKLELREGVGTFREITNCGALEEMVMPRTLFECGELKSLEHLKEIRFLNTDKFLFYQKPFASNDLPTLKDVYFYSATPPTVRDINDGLTVNNNVTIHIPQGLRDAYENSIWKGWTIVEDLPAIASSVVWSLFTKDNVLKTGQACNRGDNDAEMAILVPASEMALYKGCKISKIQFFTHFETPEYVFITKPGTDYLVKQSCRGTWGSWNTIELDDPYIITGEQIYVGAGRHHEISLNMVDEVLSSHYPFYSRAMGNDTSAGMEPGKWKAHSETNPIALRFFINSEKFPVGMTISSLKIVHNASTGDYLEAVVMNRSTNAIKSYTIEWSIDGTEKGSQTYETDLQPNSNETVTITLPVLTGRSHTVTMYVSTIDGESNSMADQTATLDFKLSSKGTYPRRIVMEEGTGTWCGPCVRGTETISRLTKEYPDNFSAIVIHVDDIMAGAKNYASIISNRFGSYPICLLNRQTKADPSYPETKNFVESEMNNGEAKIEAKARFTSSECTSVTVHTATEFAFNDTDGSKYQIAYVIVEDSVGPYSQKNEYSAPGSSHSDHYMDWWVHQEYYVSMMYNHVARGIYGNENGVRGSIPATIAKGKSYSYDYTITLPDNIVDKKNIRMITLLMDTKTDEILNAAECVIKDSDAQEGSFEEKGAEFTVQEDNTVAVTDDENVSSNYEIPETVCHDGMTYQVTTIGESAFQNNTTLEQVTIPSSVTSIGSNAFAGCVNLKAIYTNATEPVNLAKVRTRSGSGSVFDGVDKETCILYVPKGCVERYRAAEGWNEFKNIQEFSGTNIKRIGNDCQTFDVYDLRGRKVRQGTTSLEGLTKGVYIIDGRKVVK